ncbi:MAG TPA: SMP-30/gluconolactonase/LRE family protein [Bryobacteraceae bacterium]|nr:SMP-30/gluconolactonase/LRE family protein [Bryobacteraceae bacterium]
MKRTGAVLFLLCGLAGAQDFANIEIGKVAVGYQFTEGPVWSRDGYLLFSDIPASRILKLTPGGQPVVFREKSNGTNGNTFDARGRLYSCEGDARRVVRTGSNGKIEVLAERFEGRRLNAPNDIVVRKDGHVWFTDPAFGSSEKTRELDFYGVYHLSPKGALEAIARPKGRPNGIALSPDGRILYVDNSDEKNVRAYDLDKNGQASNERVVVSGIEGVPDGMKVDEKGNLYVTAKGVVVYSPEGKLLGTIPVPETPANCAFGDPDFSTLYITAQTSLYRARLNVKGAVPY